MSIKWPVNPRCGQKEVAEQLTQYLEENRRIIFSAPTGWGKTHAVLAALVTAKKLPVVWLVRSLVLARRISDDASLWGLTSFTAAGREKVCPLQPRLGDAVHDFCRLFRYRCRFYRLPERLPSARDYSELLELGIHEGWCPYFAQDYYESDVFIQNYYRRARSAKVPKAWVVDEAHNLLLPNEKTYTLGKLAESVAALKEKGASDSLQRKVESLIRYMLVKDGAVSPTLFLDESAQTELRFLHLQVLEEGDARLAPLMEIMKAVVAYVEGEKVTLFRPQSPLLYRPAIFMSATLLPGSELFLKTDAMIKVPWTIKPKCVIVSNVTTKYQEFDTKVALEYKKLIIQLNRKFERILVFVPSERVERELRGIAQYIECEPPREWRGVAMFRARGKFSEGVDVPADAVIIAGAPFLPPDVSDSLSKVYRSMGLQDPVKAAIDLPMLVTTLQCIGRAWRNPSKPPHVYLADSRFERYSAVILEHLQLE